MSLSAFCAPCCGPSCAPCCGPLLCPLLWALAVPRAAPLQPPCAARTRLYFTSESHIMSMFHILRARGGTYPPVITEDTETLVNDLYDIVWWVW